MATLDELKSWIIRDTRRRRWDAQLVSQTEHSLTYHIAADRHLFTVHADAAKNYLACTCCTRQHRPGEDHPRFADLPDGQLTAETWQQIIQEMKRLEIRPFRGPGL